METQAYSDNIREVIRAEIGKVQSEICVAVPWFTDDDLLAALVQRAKNKVVIRLIKRFKAMPPIPGKPLWCFHHAGGQGLHIFF